MNYLPVLLCYTEKTTQKTQHAGMWEVSQGIAKILACQKS